MRRFLVLVLLVSRVSADSYLADPFDERKPVANDYDSRGGHTALAWQKDDKVGQLRGSATAGAYAEKPYAPVDDKAVITKANAPWRASTSEKASESSPIVNQGVEVSAVVVPWGSFTSTKTQTEANAQGGAYKSTSAVQMPPFLDNSNPQTSTDAAGQVAKVTTPSKVNESQATVPRAENKTSTNATTLHDEKINPTSKNTSSSYNDGPSSSPVSESDSSVTPPIEKNEKDDGSVYHADTKRDSTSEGRKKDEQRDSKPTGPGDEKLPTRDKKPERATASLRDDKTPPTAAFPDSEQSTLAFVENDSTEGLGVQAPTYGGHGGDDIWRDGRKNKSGQQPGDHSGTRDTSVSPNTPYEENPVAPSEMHPAASSSEKAPVSYGETDTSEQNSPTHGSKHEGGVDGVIVPWRRGTSEAKDFGNADKTGNRGKYGVGAEVPYQKDEKHEYLPTSPESRFADSPSYPTERNANGHDKQAMTATRAGKREDSYQNDSDQPGTSNVGGGQQSSHQDRFKTSTKIDSTPTHDATGNFLSGGTANAQYDEQPTTEKAKPATYPAPEEVKQGGSVVTVDVPWESRVSKPSDSKVHASEPTHGKPQLTRDYTVDKPTQSQGIGHGLDNVIPWSEQHSLFARDLQSEPEGHQTGAYPVEESGQHAEATEEKQQPVESNGEQSVEDPGEHAAVKDEVQQTGEHPGEHTEATEGGQQPVGSNGEQSIKESVEHPAAKDENQQTPEHPVEESGEHTEVTEGGQQPVESNGDQRVEASTAVKNEGQQPADLSNKQTVGVSGEPTKVQEEGERPSEQPVEVPGNNTEIKDGVMTTMNVSGENVRWDQDDCDPCEVPTQPPTLAPIYPRGDDDYKKYLPNVTETTEFGKDLTENLPPIKLTKTPKTRSPHHDEFIHCTKIIGNYGEIYECTTNATAPPTPAPTQPQADKTCIDVSVEGDATYCIEGPICSGSDSLPAGSLCPVKGDVAVKDCWGDKLPSWTSAGACVAPVNATCARIKTAAWGCVFGEPSNATGSPATEMPSVTEAPSETPTETPSETTPSPTVPDTATPGSTPAPTEPSEPQKSTPAPNEPTLAPSEPQKSTPAPSKPNGATPAPTKFPNEPTPAPSGPQRSTPAPSQPYGATPAPTKFPNEPTPTPAVTTTREGTTYPTTTGTTKPATSTTTGTTKPATSTTTKPEAVTSTPDTSTGDDAYANTGTSGVDANNAVGASTSKGTTSTTTSGLSAGAIAGIVIACIVFAVVVVGAVLYKQRSIARQREENLFADLSATGGRPLETDYAAM
ncbi:hypothetical protein V7S43_018722 [Phytophthora oleae]|uniref:Mucin-like protein n=1 Tax=Phytophthora oleae TaxID=2107226 RepID=A0ABD3ETR6_9STRA